MGQELTMIPLSFLSSDQLLDSLLHMCKAFLFK